MDFERIRKEVDDQGFSIVEQLVSEKEVARYRSALKQAILDDMAEYGHLPQKSENLIVDMVNRAPDFARYLENDKLYNLFRTFLGEYFTLYSFTSTFLRPGERPGAAEIHVDSKKFTYLPGYHFGILVTLALDDFSEANGATYYLPGSQRLREKPSADHFYAHAVRVTRKAGDAVVFNPLVWHAAGENRTRQTRHGMTVYACRSFIKPRLDYPRMTKPEILEVLSARGKAMLGFTSRVPGSMEEYYVPASERLYVDTQGARQK